MGDSKNILFITWDSGETSYLENLFLPIFYEIQNRSSYRFYIIQYTWASVNIIVERKKIANEFDISYTAIQCKESLNSKVFTILKSKSYLTKFCKDNLINFIMPRSIWPSLIVLLSNIQLPIIYDADGLAYLEKTEYKSSSLQTKTIKFIEKAITKKSKHVLVRSHFAIEWLKINYAIHPSVKVSIVKNGVSEKKFYYDDSLREKTRKNLNLTPNDTLFIYVGSIGAKYGLDKAITVFTTYHATYPTSKFLILTSHLKEVHQILLGIKHDAITFKKVPHKEINSYLNAADFGFCFIKPSPAIKAVNPIKLNEYLMAGLPVVLNRGIGDSEIWLREGDNCIFLAYDHPKITELVKFDNLRDKNREDISQNALTYCSLNTSVNAYISILNKIAY